MSLTLTQIVEVAAADPDFVPGMSTNEFFYGNQPEERLTDVIATIADEVLDRAMATHIHTGYAEADHTHTGYAEATHDHSNYAEVDHTHNYAEVDHTHNYAEVDHTHNYADVDHTHNYAEVDHVHTDYAPIDHSQNGGIHVTEAQKTSWDSKANADHIHPEYAVTGHTHTEYASSNHGHTGYANEDHSHNEYALSNHGHTGYASSNHTHSDYAEADHTHSEYFNADRGGSIGGDTNVNGVFRVQGQQMIYFNDSTKTQTIGTNNATGGTVIACGSNATVQVNGSIVKTPMLLPKANNSVTCGNSNFRWSGIYSTAAVNVASDERLKRDIAPVDQEELVEFINHLDVVKYNYKDDPVDAEARIGLIAQQVYQADHEAARFFVTEDENGMLGLKAADLVFPLIVAVQQMSKEIEYLKSKI